VAYHHPCDRLTNPASFVESMEELLEDELHVRFSVAPPGSQEEGLDNPTSLLGEGCRQAA